MIKSRVSLKLLFVTAFFILASCSGKKQDNDNVMPITELKAQANSLLLARKYDKAAEEYGKIFFQHPGSEASAESEIMQAYSLYMAGEYEEAVDILNMFLKLHPLHKDAAYVYYLKSLCYFSQISSIKLDQSRSNLAKLSLQELIDLFPGSAYADDALVKIKLVDDYLGGKEMAIGRFYLNINNPIAAIKRFETVVHEYQTSAYAPEALYRMAECYKILGLKEELRRHVKTMALKLNDDIWYQQSLLLSPEE